MDDLHEGFHVLNRQAPHAFLPFIDHAGKVGEFLVAEPADPLDEIIVVFGEMVGHRRKNGMEHMAGPRTGQVPAFRCKFFEYGNILLIKFPWHGEFPGYLFSGLWNKRTGWTPVTLTVRCCLAVDPALSPLLCLREITGTVLAGGHICRSGLHTDYGFGLPNLTEREVRQEKNASAFFDFGT